MAIITINGNTLGSSLGSGAFQNIGTEMTRSRSSAENLASALKDLHNKIDIAQVATDLSGSINSVTKSEEREETKKTNLAVAYDKLDELITSAGVIDSQVAQKIETLKKDFYKKYSYLTPECEKSLWKKLYDFNIKVIKIHIKIQLEVVDFCKKHWKEIVKIAAIVAMVAVSVILIASGVGGPLGLAALGCLIGMSAAVISEGSKALNAVLNGESYSFNDFLNAVLIGGVTGALSGALGGVGGATSGLLSGMGKIGSAMATAAITSVVEKRLEYTINYFDKMQDFSLKNIFSLSNMVNFKAGYYAYMLNPSTMFDMAFNVLTAGMLEKVNIDIKFGNFGKGVMSETINNYTIDNFLNQILSESISNKINDSVTLTKKGISVKLPTSFYQSITIGLHYFVPLVPLVDFSSAFKYLKKGVNYYI